MSCNIGSRSSLFTGVCLAGMCLAILPPLSTANAQAPSADTAIAAAGGAGGTQLSEVVVTAGRRASDLQKTPVAISTVSSGALDASFINEISGLNSIVPSLQITQANGSENLVSIRGVGSETPENTATTTPGISEFVDGVYIVNSVSLDETLFDIDHIEVLRGPQGDLYGESSTGGAINLITKQPELKTFGASGDISGGDYDLVRARAEVNLPVGDDVAIRASIQKYSHEGFTKDTYFNDFRLDDADDLSGKVAVLWKPTSNFSATVTGQWYHSLENGAAQKNITEVDTDPRQVVQDYSGKFELVNQLYHLNLQYDLPWFSIRSVTGYQHENFIDHYDSSRSAFSVLGAYDDVAAYNTNTSSYTEEFDLFSRPGSRLEWTVGAFVLNEESKQFVVEYETPSPPNTIINPETDPSIVAVPLGIESAPYPDNLSYGNLTHAARQGYAGFGRATYHVTPKLSLTVGARVNHDSYTNQSFNFSQFGPSTVSHGFNDTVPTGRVEADYQVTGQNLLYASAARGYKPGGVNGKNGQAVVPETFHDETNTAFEVGAKNSVFDHQLRLNLAAYYYLYRDMQYIEYDPVLFDSGIANIPSIHEYGLEAEAAFQSRDHHLHIDGSVALENGFAQGNYKTINSTVANAIEGTYTYPCFAGPSTAFFGPAGAACIAAVEAASESIKGKTPPDMPKISGSLTGSYDFDTPFGVLTPRAQYVYRGSEWARIFNVAGLDRVRAYGVTNFNLDFHPTGSRLRLSLTATNAFNVDGVNSKYTDPYGTGATSQQYIPPRQIIGTVAFVF